MQLELIFKKIERKSQNLKIVTDTEAGSTAEIDHPLESNNVSGNLQNRVLESTNILETSSIGSEEC